MSGGVTAIMIVLEAWMKWTVVSMFSVNYFLFPLSSFIFLLLCLVEMTFISVLSATTRSAAFILQ